MPMIAEAMAEAGLDYRQLDLIAATLGPGSFTGVRIAIAAARGFALVTGAKLWGTDSLTVMARTALNDGAIDMHGTPFAVAADARAGALYLGLYDAAARKREGPLLVETGAAVALLPQISPLRSATAPKRLPPRRVTAGARLTQSSLTLSRVRLLSRILRRTPATVCRPCVRFISARPMPSRNVLLRWRDVDGREHRPRPSPCRAWRCRGSRRDPRRVLRARLGPRLDGAVHLGPGCLVLVASRAQSGPVEGFLIARKAEDEAEILTLAVHPACRRAGLARALIEMAMTRLALPARRNCFSKLTRPMPRLAPFIGRSARKRSGAAAAIMSTAPTPSSSALPFPPPLPMMGKALAAKPKLLR